MLEVERLGNRINIPIHPDNDGYVGRECPQCERYFKVTFGTGLKGEGLPCHCPYCGHTEGHDHFWTKEQIEYLKSVALRKITEAVHKDVKALEFDVKPQGAFGIGLSMKVKTGSLPLIRHYHEKQLETEVVCDQCTLRYTIYGVFAFCPDCRTHNSAQILNKNLELAGKQIALAKQVDSDMSAHLVADALENAVSSFDAFGREACRVYAAKASDPTKAEKLSFQNPNGVDTNVRQLFGIGLSAALLASDWSFVCRSFQKRHLLAHKMGVVDEAYIKATADPHAVEGRKVGIKPDEVLALLTHLKTLGAHLLSQLRSIP